MGLFGPSRKDLLRWQNLVVTPMSNHLHFSRQQLHNMSIPIAQRHLEIAEDCYQLIHTTANPKVFFERLDLLDKELHYIQALSEFLDFSGSDPRKLLFEIHSDSMMLAFVDRCWKKTAEKAAQLKTDKGQKNQYIKFKEALCYYSIRFSPTVKQHIDDLCRTVEL